MSEYVPALGIRAQYVSGNFDRRDALTRIRMGGFTELASSRAEEILAAPITPAVVLAWTAREVTEEQIAARLAEVTA